jgi:hypothetical protein
MDFRRLEHRSLERARMVVGVKISDSETDSGSGRLVHTLDLCGSGAKLGGFREEMVVGKIVVLHRKHKKAPCKIVWTRAVGPGELQIGIQLLKEDRNFWVSILPQKTSPRPVCRREATLVTTRTPVSRVAVRRPLRKP